jgi:hypothetical protein
VPLIYVGPQEVSGWKGTLDLYRVQC